MILYLNLQIIIEALLLIYTLDYQTLIKKDDISKIRQNKGSERLLFCL